jgi:hypothetical protein
MVKALLKTSGFSRSSAWMLKRAAVLSLRFRASVYWRA